MLDVAALVAVLAVATVDLVLALAIGVGFDAGAVGVAVVAAVGGCLGVIGFTAVGDRVREWARRRRAARGREPASPGRRRRRVQRLFDRYGIPGMGLLAPPITTAPVAVMVGLTLGAERRRLAAWCCAGVVLWSVVGTALLAGGVSLFR